MESAFFYVGLSAVLTILLWVPYITARIFIWGIPTFLNNYPEGYPATQPKQPLWVERSQSAHMNMVETLPAFLGVVFAASYFAADDVSTWQTIAYWTQVFFWARVLHAIVYTLGIPYLRTPVYLVSWAAILAISAQFLF